MLHNTDQAIKAKSVYNRTLVIICNPRPISPLALDSTHGLSRCQTLLQWPLCYPSWFHGFLMTGLNKYMQVSLCSSGLFKSPSVFIELGVQYITPLGLFLTGYH